MTTPEFVDPARDPDASDQDVPPSDDVDAERLLDDLDQGLYQLAVVAETLAQALSQHDVGFDRTQRSALEGCRDNATAIVASLDRVV